MTLTRAHKWFFLFLASLAHLLLLFSFIISFNFKAKPLDADLKLIPAYIYREEKYNPQPTPPLVTNEEQKISSKIGIEKPVLQKTKSTQTRTETLSMGNGMQNVNLTLKSKNSMDKPLLNLITKAVAAHLAYPKIAMDFRLRGRAIVGFMIYPDGHLTDVTLLSSSGTSVLDYAAVQAIRAISPVKNVQMYLAQPEPLMMGIIFQ